MRLLYFFLFSLALLIATCAAFDDKNELLKDELPEIEIPETSKADVPSQDLAKAAKGKKLFIANCASCHNKNMKDDMTAPALAGVRERWEGREDLLFEWIKNSQKVIADGDPYAMKLYKDWNNSVMTSFPFSNEDIEEILDYIDAVSKQ